MNPMIATLPTLAVTAIYYCWHVLYLEKCRRERVLREARGLHALDDGDGRKGGVTPFSSTDSLRA